MNFIKAACAAEVDEPGVGFYVTDQLVHLLAGEIDCCRIAVIHTQARSDSVTKDAQDLLQF